MANNEVVISGIAGTFPQCSSVQELEDNIFNNENHVTELHSKWKLGSVNLAPYGGKIKDIYNFDQTFFGVHRKLCQVMDCHAKHCLEKTFEALCDAGLNPHELSGTNGAVIMCTMTSETEFGSVLVSKNSGHAMVGHSRSMQSNRISYFFDLNGPSMVLNASWTAAMQGLEIASNLLAKGQVKIALVGASNLLFFPELTVHFEGLKILNPDGKTKSFSGNADGYSRSEGVTVFVLQRAEDALRSYGSLVKVNSATEMNHPATFSDRAGFENYISDFYSDLHINNSDIGYIEGDGSASLRTDAMELNGLANTICSGRSKPLLVGSCKSKLGHAESASPLISIVNALIAFKTGFIPPCLHYSSPNPLVPGLLDGRLKIVTEKTPLQGNLIGVTNMGIGSIFGHVLLKRNPKSRPVRDPSYFPPDGIPRIFLLSGRDEELMNKILVKVGEKAVDEFFYALNHNLFKSTFPKHLFRGYSLVNKYSTASRSVSPYSPGLKRPVWFIFSGMGSQWLKMGTGLMEIKIIRRAIEKCHNVLKPKGIDLISIITSDDPTIYDNILHAFVGIAAIQIGLVDLLEDLGVEADGIVGHSVGELGCSYADKCMTAEQVILAAYARGKASNDAELIRGMMAAVGKGYSDIKDKLPEGIEVACHNSKTSCTLSGPSEIMENYVEELKSKGIFARLVNVANIAYHSKNIAPAAPFLLKYLKQIIPEPKLRSSKWVSSSVPEDQWERESAKYCSAEYHTNNLLSYVLFEEATSHIPKESICIEIAPHGLLQAIVKRSLSSCTHIPLTNKVKEKGCDFLIEALAKLFSAGVNMDFSKLYPPVEFPVPRETDYMNVITWDHSEQWVPLALQYNDLTKSERQSCWKNIAIRSNEETLDYEQYHNVQGKTFFPKAKLLECFMSVLKEQTQANSLNLKCYEFQNIQFHQDVMFNTKENANLNTLFQHFNGLFEALYKNNPVVTGRLTHTITSLPKAFLCSDFVSNQKEQAFICESQIYDYFENNGCVFKGPFRNISSITIFEKGFAGKIKWKGSSELYLDALIKLLMFYSSIQKDTLMDLDKIYQLIFDPAELPENDKDVDIYYDKNLEYLCGEGVRLLFFKTKPSTQKMDERTDLRNLQFTLYSNIESKVDFMEVCLQIIRENASTGILSLQLIVDENSKLCKSLVQNLNNNDLRMKYKIHLRSRNTVSEASKRPNDCYLIIDENEHHDNVNKLLTSNMLFYYMHCGDCSKLKKVPQNLLTSIVHQEVNGHCFTLYKQRKIVFNDSVFIQMPGDDFVKEIESIQDSGKVTYFLLFKYRMLSDVICTLQSSNNCITNKKSYRFIFIDDSSPQFDPNNDFYKEQLAKDLKINIAFRRMWGSLRSLCIHQRSQISNDVRILKTSLNQIRCKTVDLKVIGLNSQSLMLTNKYRKLGVTEYSGIVDKNHVFGLSKVTEDNYLETDSKLCWKMPAGWTFQDAATVPLYYCMAYDLLCIKGSHTNRPRDSMLIHGGHTPLGQAVITIAIDLGIAVYTTCFSETQKIFILETYPQIEENNVYIIEDKTRNSFIKTIKDLTNGEGVEIVIDPLEDNGLRDQTIQCTGKAGSYYYVTNSDMDNDHTFGMNVFLNEVAVFGYNPELIFDLKEEDKLRLGELLRKGIDKRVVKPLKCSVICGTVTKHEAANIMASKSNEELPHKVIVPMRNIEYLTAEIANDSPKRKHYIIIGIYNCLWFDVLKWLVSQGADSISVVLNQDEIPQYMKVRYNNFIAKYKYINVTFDIIENLNSAQKCNNLIKDFLHTNIIDTVFYIKPGFEKAMTNIDYALRLHSKRSCLITIGFQACRISERRRNDGFKGVSFILMKTNLKNGSVINALDKWLKTCDENDEVILVDKFKFREKRFLDKYCDILPSNGREVVDLHRNISSKPRLIEIVTKCSSRRYARNINPVFIFPGLKVEQLKKFSRQLFYPAFMAQYPTEIKSLEDTAVVFSEMLISTFDYSMYTLIAEGWSGSLVLEITKLLEERGKMSEVILLDAAPESIQQWNTHFDKSNSVISKYMPTIREGEQLSINYLKSWSAEISKTILREEGADLTEDEVISGFNVLINRLETAEHFRKDIMLQSTVHLFTLNNLNNDDGDLKRCSSSFTHHPVESSSNFFESSELIEIVNLLPLVEHKMSANEQTIREIATTDLIRVSGSNKDESFLEMIRNEKCTKKQ